MHVEPFRIAVSDTVLTDLRASIGKDVTVKADVHLHHEQFDVMAV